MKEIFTHSILCALLMHIPLLSFAAIDDTELTIYTYDSFVSEWGSGPKLKTAFEKQCHCQVKFVAAEDGVGILNRLRIEGKQTKADIILGIDDALMEETRRLGLIAPHEQDLSTITPALAWQDKDFLPFDYGYFAFIYNSSKLTEPVTSLKALVESDATVIYQDPRTSTPGQGLLLWVKAVYGDEAPAAWQQLAKHTVTVTKGWWEAYSMFMDGGADYVLSYSTSPAYHVVSESQTQFNAALFDEGHIAQVEVAALLKNSDHPELAKQFLQFLTTPTAQAIIPVTNWMLPVIKEVKLPTIFDQLIQPKRIGFSAETVAAERKNWLKEWRESAVQE